MKPVSHLFIITYPRTGSTTLLRAVNTADGHLLRGESIGIINHAYRMYADINNLVHHVPGLMPEVPVCSDKSPIQGAELIKLHQVKNTLRNFFHLSLLQPEESTVVTGWKETMINPARDGEEFCTKVIEFMAETFKDSRFILNVRNPFDVSHSSIWRHNNESIHEIKKYRDWLLDLPFSSSIDKNKFLLVDHDKWNKNPESLISSLQGFGVPVKEEQAKLVLSEKLTHLSYI